MAAGVNISVNGICKINSHFSNILPQDLQNSFFSYQNIEIILFIQIRHLNSLWYEIRIFIQRFNEFYLKFIAIQRYLISKRWYGYVKKYLKEKNSALNVIKAIGRFKVKPQTQRYIHRKVFQMLPLVRLSWLWFNYFTYLEVEN